MQVLAQNEALRTENSRLHELHADAARRLSDYQLGLTRTLPPALQDDSWLFGPRSSVAASGAQNVETDELLRQNAELRRKLRETRARNEELARRVAGVARAYEARRGLE